MIKNIFLATLISFLLANCSKQNNTKSHLSIVGGSETEYPPYYAGITYSQDGQQINCGATFIEKRILLTAAHCFDNFWYQMRYIRVGIGDQHLADKYLKIESIIIHENWDSKKVVNDIAIIKVEDYQEADLGVKITPLEIDSNPHFISDHWTKPLKIVGTGSISSYGLLKDIKIKQAQLKLMPIKQCKEVFKRFGEEESLDEKNLCTGEENVAALAPCRGDSGSPLIAEVDGKETLVGVEVAGIRNCGQTGSPAVYNKVSMYAVWIQQKLAFLKDPVPDQEIGSKILEYQKTGCFYNFTQLVEKTSENYSNLVRPNFKIGGIVSPISYTKKVDPILGELIPSTYPCSFEVPHRGVFRVEMRFDGSEFKMLAINKNEVWESKTNFEISDLNLDCDYYASLGYGKLSLYNEAFELTEYYLRPLDNAPNLLLKQNIVRECRYGAVSVVLYEILEDNKRQKYAKVTADFFGKVHEFHYKARQTYPELEPSTPIETPQQPPVVEPKPDFIATIKVLSNGEGDFKFKNNSNIELYTWELQCNQPITLVDLQGQIYHSVANAAQTKHLLRFEVNQTSLGTLMPQEQLEFKISTPKELIELTCYLNNMPLEIMYE